MVKFVAKQPVNQPYLQQLAADVVAGTPSVSDRSSTSFTVTQSDNVTLELFFTGSSIKYAAGFPVSGKIKKLVVQIDGAVAYKFTKLDISVPKAVKLTQANDIYEAIKKLTKGNDEIKLSDADDELNAGKGNDNVKANGGDDDIKGGKGKDELDGGTGNNILNGGKGKDCYVFKSAPELGMSTITKFQSGETMKLSGSAFAGIGKKGDLKGKYFEAGTAADDADDRIIYDETTGAVYYDSDGNGAAAQVQFAQLKVGTSFDKSDILVI